MSKKKPKPPRRDWACKKCLTSVRAVNKPTRCKMCGAPFKDADLEPKN